MWRIVLCASVVALLAGCGNDAEDKSAESTAASSASSAVPEPDPLTGLLLPAATVNSMTSATLPDLAESADLADSAATVDPSTCAPALGVAERAAYADSGFTAVERATLRTAADASYYYSVDQAVVALPSPERATQLLADTERLWQGCLGTPIVAADGTSSSLLGVENRSGTLVSDRAVDGAGARYGCQHAVAARAAVVADVVVCADVEVGNRSQAIAEAILAQVG